MRRRNPTHTKRLLARNLRRLRAERAWSQDDLAAEAKVRQALVSALEAMMNVTSAGIGIRTQKVQLLV
ncbi:MAG: hypothetical protein CFE29_02955 [Bradyrhizobiaceae bacterium PARB1]|jgi:transcriptional regulator with XRE-family HTH domain|nr:MAG: hypothetical protein CFE29_02955 [Bradyrhizobiaceae bacterium PARB1]